jgi:hypothetical protein
MTVKEILAAKHSRGFTMALVENSRHFIDDSPLGMVLFVR